MEDNTTISKNKRVRDDSEESVSVSVSDSPLAKRIRDDLLDILDDSELTVDRNPATEDLDSVMKSFEEEISHPSPPTADLTSISGEAQPELGYLLEASDDELGLPPTSSSSGEDERNVEDYILRVPSDTVGLDQIWGFEDEIPGYEFGIGEENENINTDGEFLALGGLFDYSDVLCGQSDYSDFSWRPESLPAL